jgi:predicted nucleotidyltransferase
MNPNDPNIQAVQVVAKALGELLDEFVFLGGCAAGLLITDMARPPVRATQDVDLITEVASRAEYYRLSEKLRQLGFREARDEVICRWHYGNLKVDIMPTDEEILTFSNRWYSDAVNKAAQIQLPNGVNIRVVSAPHFLATKLEAFHGRGKGDYGASHDIEDIVSVVDGRPEITQEVASSDEPLRLFLQEEFDALLGDKQFTETLSWHLPGDAANQGRVPLVLERLLKIAGL